MFNEVINFNEFTVFGSRGHTLMILRGAEPIWKNQKKLLALIDEIENNKVHPTLGVPIISLEERKLKFNSTPVLLTAANSHLRERIANQIASEGGDLITIRGLDSPFSEVDQTVEYGVGCVVAPYTRLGSNVRIGVGSQVLSTMIAHDVVIGDFSTLNVNSTVLGHVIIGQHVTIAPHVVIANGTPDRPLKIGDGSTIGVGAVVVKDVKSGARMIGNPAITVDEWKDKKSH